MPSQLPPQSPFPSSRFTIPRRPTPFYLENRYLLVAVGVLVVLLALTASGFVYAWRQYKASEAKYSALHGAVVNPPQLAILGEPGPTGELPEESDDAQPVGALPRYIFNTTGTVTAIKDTIILVRGSGTNFADGAPRDLHIAITPLTYFTTPDSPDAVLGPDGLKLLKEGDEVVLDSAANIRGFTEFEARAINII